MCIRVNGINERTPFLNLPQEAVMFFEVRVYKPNGKFKKKISSTELSIKHWEKFEKIEEGIGLNNFGIKPVSAWVKAKLDLEFPSNLESDYQRSQG
jgi:hypothetical protein